MIIANSDAYWPCDMYEHIISESLHFILHLKWVSEWGIKLVGLVQMTKN
jgi:hypothetical protein